MVEIEKKYKINVKKFGIINLEGFISLYLRECSRFFVVWAQTLLSPLVSSLLFLTVLTFALKTVSTLKTILKIPFFLG